MSKCRVHQANGSMSKWKPWALSLKDHYWDYPLLYKPLVLPNNVSLATKSPSWLPVFNFWVSSWIHLWAFVPPFLDGQSLILLPKPIRVYIIITWGARRNFSVLFYLNVSKTMLLHTENSILLHILSLVILALKDSTFNNFEAAGYQKYQH